MGGSAPAAWRAYATMTGQAASPSCFQYRTLHADGGIEGPREPLMVGVQRTGHRELLRGRGETGCSRSEQDNDSKWCGGGHGLSTGRGPLGNMSSIAWLLPELDLETRLEIVSRETRRRCWDSVMPHLLGMSPEVSVATGFSVPRARRARRLMWRGRGRRAVASGAYMSCTSSGWMSLFWNCRNDPQVYMPWPG